jgi:nondiscriminating aspartyl-tRNA synthetase
MHLAAERWYGDDLALSPAEATNIMVKRMFAADLATYIDQDVIVKGWARFVRNTKSTTFIVRQDVSRTVQLVGPADLPVHVKREDALEIVGRVRQDQRAPHGIEVDIVDLRVLGEAAASLPFLSGSDLADIGLETVLDYRPLALRTERGGTIFRVQAALVEGFRAALRRRRFTEIFSSKIGANLFAIRYFERIAYLAQSPQFYKEHGVLGLERVFETGHVYRAEPHATARHLTEYYSLDLEMGFINGPEDIIAVERELLTEMFENVRQACGAQLAQFDAYLPSLLHVPLWTFDECLDRLK